MKKLLFTFHFFALCILFTSCTKTDNQISGIENTPSDVLKGTPGNNGGTTNRDAHIPPTSTCTPTVVSLMAGQHIDAGTVTVTNDANFIYITYNTANGYVLTQTHLFAGECALIPVNRRGNPIPGQFPYTSAHSNLTSYTYQIPVSAIPVGACGCIASHAVVGKLNASGAVVNQQTAWGNGIAINPNGQWGMRFDYCSCL